MIKDSHGVGSHERRFVCCESRPMPRGWFDAKSSVSFWISCWLISSILFFFCFNLVWWTASSRRWIDLRSDAGAAPIYGPRPPFVMSVAFLIGWFILPDIQSSPLCFSFLFVRFFVFFVFLFNWHFGFGMVLSAMDSTTSRLDWRGPRNRDAIVFCFLLNRQNPIGSYWNVTSRSRQRTTRRYEKKIG